MVVKMKSIIKMRKIQNSDDAVVGIVVTVLLIGLILAVIVMLNTVYLPQWLEASEATQMEEVSNQFTQLKYALDIQTIANDSTGISTSIVLGTREIPFFDKGRTFGFLEITDDDCTIIINSNVTSSSDSYSSDSIKFSSGNSYFVDQDYIYQAGALILSQETSSMLYGKPSFLVTEYGENMSFTIVNISGITGKKHVSGYGIYPIYTECINPNNQYTVINNVTNITVFTDYPNAWKLVFNNSLISENYHGIRFRIDDSYNDRVIVKFFDSDGDYFNLAVREVDISAQIAFGILD
jgi:hypothetical protein